MTSKNRSSSVGGPALVVSNLVKSFNGRRVVDDVSFSLSAGRVCALLGPNGSGKTTTVRMITTLLQPDTGSVVVFGRSVEQDAGAVRALIRVTGQAATLDHSLTVDENLHLFGRLLGLSRAGVVRRTREVLSAFGLSGIHHQPVRQLSGGMRRRLDLAASVIVPGPLLVLDEPTTGLDPTSRRQLWSLIRSMVDDGTTVLLTTQYLEEADQLADHIVFLDGGRIVAEGTPEELKHDLGRPVLRLFLADSSAEPALVDVVSRLQQGPLQRAEDQKSVSIKVENSVDALTVLNAVTTAGIPLSDFEIIRPSLDDVFAALTRQRAA